MLRIPPPGRFFCYLLGSSFKFLKDRHQEVATVNEVSAKDQQAAEQVVAGNGISATVTCALKGDLVYREVALEAPDGQRVVGTDKNSYAAAALSLIHISEPTRRT